MTWPITVNCSISSKPFFLVSFLLYLLLLLSLLCWAIEWSLAFMRASLVAQMVKNLPAMRETWVWSLGWEDPPGGGRGNPHQYSCLEHPHGQRSLATVHGVTKSWTQLSNYIFTQSSWTEGSLYIDSYSPWWPPPTPWLHKNYMLSACKSSLPVWISLPWTPDTYIHLLTHLSTWVSKSHLMLNKNWVPPCQTCSIIRLLHANNDYSFFSFAQAKISASSLTPLFHISLLNPSTYPVGSTF